ncbi:MAG: inositol monophosphatase family protein [Rhodospirillales bacterium]|jgi:myo-inositol-1(or 4)-monophosphatase|nr:inositol monophosphatase family protein [Rhodospirillales bacterium]
MPLRSALINVMAGAARKAARSLVRDFGEVEQLQVSKKGPADFVSAADHRAEDVLHAALATARPGYGFLFEERGAVAGDDPDNRWIVDPLDGTTNFLHGVPHFSISIALERKRELIAGVVYEPICDELFWAEKGAGAHMNHRRLRVSGHRGLEDSMFATGFRYTSKGDETVFLKQVGAVMSATLNVRRLGSAALDLAYVAAGRFDGFWELNLNPWDMAAGIVLVREAGGFVNDFAGGHEMLSTGGIIAANATVHAAFAELMRAATPPPGSHC